MIEEQALPELTCSAEAIACYISLRDRMISLYRDVPGRPLLAVDCFRHLASDPATLLRIHAFLDFWGIINTDAQGRIRFKKTLAMLSEPPPPQRAGGRAAGGSKDSSKQTVRGFGRCAVTGEPLQRLCYALKTNPKYMLSPTAYVLVSFGFAAASTACRRGVGLLLPTGASALGGTLASVPAFVCQLGSVASSDFR